ncbi:MAG TPA: trypsin-like peptidase domain-containing protein [Mucilaginibacter sp.]|jgi:WD40 repeat protein|nr:trypsin-like peptidase domain-containing protein [Mucilaginibacter sp.]
MDFQLAVIRLMDNAGFCHGAGFIVSPDGIALTCTHVIDDLGLAPGETIRVSVRAVGLGVDADTARPTNGYNEMTARLLDEYSRPTSAEDLAFLQLMPLTPTVFPFLRLLSEKLVKTDNAYQVFGFPRTKNLDGLPGLCRITGSATENACAVYAMASDEITLGFSGGPVWDREHGGVLGVVVSILPPDEYARLGKTAFMVPPETVWECCPLLAPSAEPPYQGLSFFDQEKAGYYFGRDRLIGKVIGMLRDSNFLMIIGVSGSGKSSLVRAGLEKGKTVLLPSEPWLANRDLVVFSVKPPPVLSLLERLEKVTGGFGDAGSPAELAALNDNALIDTLVRILAGRRLLLVVDQFEYVFTQSAPTDAGRFIRLLCAIVASECRLVISMRIEFYKDVLTHPELGPLAARSRIDLLPMDENEIREVINSPAKMANLRVSGRLESKLAYEYLDQPGSLPHLQFALHELWTQDHATGILSLETYERLSEYQDALTGEKFSGAVGMIVRMAYREIDKRPGDLREIRKIFLSLVAVRKDAGTDELVYAGFSKQALLNGFDGATRVVALSLTESFLLVSDIDTISKEPVIGVAHECLLESWPLVRGWIREYQPFILWQSREFGPHYQEWIGNQKSRNFLLNGAATRQAKKYLEEYGTEFDSNQQEFIRKSLLASVFQTVLAIAAPTFIVAALIYSVMSGINGKRIVARGLTENGTGQIEKLYYNNAYKTFRRALQLEDTLPTRQALVESFSNQFSIIYDRKGNGVVYDISGDNRTALSALANQAQLVDLVSGNLRQLPALDPKLRITRAKISPNGDLAVLGLSDGSIRIWDTRHQKWLAEPQAKPSGRSVSAVAVSDRGLLAFADENRGAFIYDIATRHFSRLRNSVDVWCLVFNKAADRLYGGDADGAVVNWRRSGMAWDRGDDKLTNGDTVNAIDLSPDENFIATGGTDAVVSILSLKENDIVRRLAGQGGAYTAVQFTPDGGGLFTGGEDGVFSYWDLSLAQEWARWKAGEKRVVSIRAAGPKRECIVSFASGRVIHTRLLENALVSTIVSSSFPTIKIMTVSGDGRSLAFASGDDIGKVMIWDLSKGRYLDSLTNDDNEVLGLAFSSDGRYLAASGANGHLKIWETKYWRLRKSIPCHRGVNGLTADSSGGFIAGSSLVSKDHSLLIRVDRTLRVDSFRFPKGSVFSLSASRSYLITGGGDSTVKVFDLRHRLDVPADSLPLHNGSVWATAVDRSGTRAASGAEDRLIRIYTIGNDLKAKEDRELPGHLGGIYSLAFNPAHNWLASGSNDQTIRLWDLDSKKSIMLTNFHHPVYMIKFSPNGDHLFVCGLSSDIQVIDFNQVMRIWSEPPRKLPTE